MTGGSTTSSSEWVRYRKMGAAGADDVAGGRGEAMERAGTGSAGGERRGVSRGSHRRATYGSLANEAAQLKAPADVALKIGERLQADRQGRRCAWIRRRKLMGRRNLELMCKLPGMLTAVVARAPVFGGKVVKVDASEALKIPGVKAVEQVPSGVAVIAEGFWPAKLGRDKLAGGLGSGAERESFERADVPRILRRRRRSPGLIAKKVGDPAAALGGAAKTITAEYDVPYLAHCMMEPLNCVVDLRADSCEIWTGTQFQTGDCAAAAKVAGLPFRASADSYHAAGRRIRAAGESGVGFRGGRRWKWRRWRRRR